MPNFAAYTTEGTFDANLFFNWEEMAKETNYMPYVRESENHGIGGLNPGFGYIRNPEFCMVIRSGTDNETVLNKQISKIPRFYEDFHHVIIE